VFNYADEITLNRLVRYSCIFRQISIH